MRRADLALAIFTACRGRRHPTQGGEHWNAATRLLPFVEQQRREAAAEALETVARRIDADHGGGGPGAVGPSTLRMYAARALAGDL